MMTFGFPLHFTRAFESELRMYEGDDPLDVWHRYVKYKHSHIYLQVGSLKLNEAESLTCL